MKGYVEISRDSGKELIYNCLNSIDNYAWQYEEVIKSSWFGLKKRKVRVCQNTPHWYGYEDALKREFNTLLKMLDKPDPVHLSLDCYSEMIKLSDGDRKANPIFILNY